MAIIATKVQKASGANGAPEQLVPDDKLELVKKTYGIVDQATPNYDQRQREMNTFEVELSEDYDVAAVSEINKRYALTQSYLSRISTIETEAANNVTNWTRLRNLLKAYLLDRESELIVKKEIIDLPNQLTQKAAVHNKLKKIHETVAKFEDQIIQAENYRQTVVLKKKDLQSVLTNLNRQQKALETERPGGY